MARLWLDGSADKLAGPVPVIALPPRRFPHS